MDSFVIIRLIISILVVVGWVGVSVYTVLVDKFSFYSKTHWTMSAPKGSHQEIDKHLLGNYFPQHGIVDWYPIAILFSAQDKGTDVFHYREQFRSFAKEADVTFRNCTQDSQQAWCFYRRLDSIFALPLELDGADEEELLNTQEVLLHDRYINPSNESTLMIIELNHGYSLQNMYSDYDLITKQVKELAGKHGLDDIFDVGVTSLRKGLRDSKNGMVTDTEQSEIITLPIALVVLAYVVGPGFIIIFITLPISFCVLMLVLSIFANTMAFPTFSPPIFISLLVAMSIDYTLFLLARYKEEIQKGQTNANAVYRMWVSAGKTIFVSGTLLALSFGGLYFSTMKTLQAVGTGGFWTMIILMCVNLTLTPALILILPVYFKKFPSWKSCCARVEEKVEYQRNIFFHAAQWTRQYPFTIVFVVLLFTGSLGTYGVMNAGYSVSTSALQPRDSQSIQVDKAIVSNNLLFGMRNPFFVYSIAKNDTIQATNYDYCSDVNSVDFVNYCTTLIDKKCNSYHNLTKIKDCFDQYGNVCPALHNCQQANLMLPGGVCGFIDKLFNNTSNEHFAKHEVDMMCSKTCNTCAKAPRPSVFDHGFWNEQLAFIEWMMQLKEYDLKSNNYTVRSITWPFGAPIDLELALKYMDEHSKEYSTAKAVLYRAVVRDLVSFDGHAVLLQVTPQFDPVSEEALAMLVDIRKKMYNPANITNTSEFHSVSALGQLYDSTNVVFETSPKIFVLVVVTVVFCLSILAFRSLLLTIRLLLTVVVTLVSVYALEIIWLRTFMGDRDPYWIIIVVMAPVLIGLTIDYDTFLISRIYEYRLKGYGTAASIIRGVSRTGYIISTAGLIMIIAFSALLISEVPILNQYGFALVCGCLFDTFIIRPLFVPALMFCFVEGNWWPGRVPLPDARKSEIGEEGYDSDENENGDNDLSEFLTLHADGATEIHYSTLVGEDTDNPNEKEKATFFL